VRLLSQRARKRRPLWREPWDIFGRFLPIFSRLGLLSVPALLDAGRDADRHRGLANGARILGVKGEMV
jgi:hypothetical protein